MGWFLVVLFVFFLFGRSFYFFTEAEKEFWLGYKRQGWEAIANSVSFAIIGVLFVSFIAWAELTVASAWYPPTQIMR